MKLIRGGVRELLKSAEIASECMAQAERIRNNCGAGYVTESRTYRERSGAAVYPKSYKAIHDNFKDNVLLRNLHG